MALQDAIANSEGEFSTANVPSGEMAEALVRFGLKPQPTLLRELSEAEAVSVLACLFQERSSMHGEPIDNEQARKCALGFMDANAKQTSKFFSNGNWAKSKSWNAMTDSSFDSGVILKSADNSFVCLWFRDDE